MSVKLSVLIPSIRPQNLRKLYDSIRSSFSGEFEAIIASPYPLPEDMQFDNVKLITTWRSPLAAQQEALTYATGEYVSWAADDGIYLPGALDKAFELLENADYKTVVMGKYQEGERRDDHMERDEYYMLDRHHGSMAAFIPKDCLMLNCGILSRNILLELGGWDAKTFTTCPPGYNDLAVRLQLYGCKFIIQQELMFSCSHMPGETGDHAPIHIVQTRKDEPMFRELWNHPYYSKRRAIDINNWKDTPTKWENRFGA